MGVGKDSYQSLDPSQGLHRLEKYLNLKGFLEKSLKVKSLLKVLENTQRP